MKQDFNFKFEEITLLFNSYILNVLENKSSNSKYMRNLLKLFLAEETFTYRFFILNHTFSFVLLNVKGKRIITNLVLCSVQRTYYS